MDPLSTAVATTRPKRELLDFTRLTGHDLAKILNKMPSKYAARLVQTNRHLSGMADYVQSAFSYRKKSMILYCDAEEVLFRPHEHDHFYMPNTEDGNRYYFDELILGIASNDVDLLDLPQRLPRHLKCRRLIIRTYHPFIMQINSIFIESAYSHFGARDLQLHLVPIFGEFCIKPGVTHLSYFVMAEDQMAEWICKFPFAPYMFLDFAGLTMCQIVKVAVGLWMLGRLPYQKWLRIRLYHDSEADFDATLVQQEFADFFTTFPNHVIYPKEVKVEELLPYRPEQRVIIPNHQKSLGVVLFSEPNKIPTIMGRREALVDFFPSYNPANGYDPAIFEPMTIDHIFFY